MKNHLLIEMGYALDNISSEAFDCWIKKEISSSEFGKIMDFLFSLKETIDDLEDLLPFENEM